MSTDIAGQLTVSKNRWTELITVEPAMQTVGKKARFIGGWGKRYCISAGHCPIPNCVQEDFVTDADGISRIGTTIDQYSDDRYLSKNITPLTTNLGALVGLWNTGIQSSYQAKHVQSFTVDQSIGDTTIINIPRFDPSAISGDPKLVAVRIDVLATAQGGTGRVENLAGQPLSGSVAMGRSISLSGPITGGIQFTDFEHEVTEIEKGQVDQFTAPDQSKSYSVTLTSDMLEFIGSGYVPLTIRGHQTYNSSLATGGVVECYQLGVNGSFVATTSDKMRLYFNDDIWTDNLGKYTVIINGVTYIVRATEPGGTDGPLLVKGRKYTYKASGVVQWRAKPLMKANPDGNISGPNELAWDIAFPCHEGQKKWSLVGKTYHPGAISELIGLPNFRGSVTVTYYYTIGDIITPFKVGSSFDASIPNDATQLALGFHDEYAWNDNFGHIDIEVTFDGQNIIPARVYGTQSLYFLNAPAKSIGPFDENIDFGTTGGCGYGGGLHRPLVIDVPAAASRVSIRALESTARTEYEPDEYAYLKLQRELYARMNYDELTVAKMLWERGLNIEDYNCFLYENGDLNNVPMTYDCVACHFNGPTIVAIKKTVRASKSKILEYIKRGGILPQRIQ